ncbi:LuxR C-terminal-related transcriptional regulator [Lacinutrix sp. C3R15]|uniref:response regulator transcription factor n=1 Tax=Flavobacteriaceae TaxID=49546 RepID=UPI001C092985|nr:MULTISPECIES: LuxR C-terminal-related transcriptional regulator [Flavobacteriaceae]MBU2940579.1 LuxR C-terminal-related transcriptional regulator [Lacinutrix sp. C3R15]MDO6623897.1 LuxR C-terminal-related transcriptional regulator [Oceanihabitans sp. 1_MG-2023]
MNLYTSKYLTIHKRDPILAQKWTGEKLNATIFKREMLEFQKIFEIVQPKCLLWNHENFDYTVPKELYSWIDTNISQKQIPYGLVNIAFTVSKDVISHMSVTDSIEKHPREGITPKYFLFEEEAEKYLLSDLKNKTNGNLMKESTNNPFISLDIAFSDLQLTKGAIENLKEELLFAKINKEKFNSLTQRELDVFKQIVLGKSNKETASVLFISSTTVATHRKHIIKKLHLNSFYDWFMYAKAFSVI